MINFTDFSQSIGQLSLVADLLKNLTLVFTVLVPVAFVVLLIIYLLQFKHKIQIRKRTKDGQEVIKMETRFRFVQKLGDNEQIQVMKGFKKHPVPPDDYLQLRENGKYFLVAYEKPGGYLQYIKPKLSEDKKDFEIAEECPIDWDFYVTMGEKRKQRYSTHNIWSTLSTIGPSVIMLITLVMLFTYWKDIQEPNVKREQIALQRDQLQLQITQNQLQYLNRLEQMVEVNTIPEETFNNSVQDKGVPD